jgi:hypothetical protein
MELAALRGRELLDLCNRTRSWNKAVAHRSKLGSLATTSSSIKARLTSTRERTSTSTSTLLDAR